MKGIEKGVAIFKREAENDFQTRFSHIHGMVITPGPGGPEEDFILPLTPLKMHTGTNCFFMYLLGLYERHAVISLIAKKIRGPE